MLKRKCNEVLKSCWCLSLSSNNVTSLITAWTGLRELSGGDRRSRQRRVRLRRRGQVQSDVHYQQQGRLPQAILVVEGASKMTI